MVFNIVSLVLAAVVIAILYRRVKAWDEEHAIVPARDCDDLPVERRKAA